MKDQTGVIQVSSIFTILLLGRVVYVVKKGKLQNPLPSDNMKNNRVDAILISNITVLEKQTKNDAKLWQIRHHNKMNIEFR